MELFCFSRDFCGMIVAELILLEVTILAKLILIDGNSIANRAFYALPMLSNKQGIHTNAALGFTTMLLRMLEEEQPDYLACVFDAGKITFRHQSYGDYKGKRQKTPSELSEQFPLIKSILTAFDIPCYELTNYEADDLMGTFSRQAMDQEIHTILVSGDKDTFQLVNDYTTVYLTKKGISDTEIVTPDTLWEKYGLRPEQMIDLKGLMGDTSDNIPGVPGVGEKTALKLIQEYGNLETVMQNIENISGAKLKERLSENVDQAFLSKQLATINNQVPMEIDWDSAKRREFCKDKVLSVFETLEFKQLIERMKLRQTDTASEKQEKPELAYEVVDSCEKVAACLGAFDRSRPIAVCIETDGDDYHNDEIYVIALVQGDNRFVISQDLIDCEHVADALRKSMLCVFDSKSHYYLCRTMDTDIRNIEMDIMLANYLLDPGDGQRELADIVENYGIPLVRDEDFYGKNKRNRQELSEEAILRHAVEKAEAIDHVSAVFMEKLQEHQLYELFKDIELPLALILADMEKQGIAVDEEILQEIGKELTGRIENLTSEIYALAGEEFNINSPKQMGTILFDKLGLPPIKKTKTGYSTSADVLEKLAPHHQIVDYILLHRQLGKLQSTYIEGLLKVIEPETHKIHTFYNQALTATGRLSSTEPNLQNIPIRLEEGRKIRKAFIPSKVGWKLLAADYSQIELRVLAHISRDPKLMEAFQMNMDIHTKTASDVFGVPPEQVTSLMRRQAKAVNFGIVYGISDYGLSQNLNIARKEAKDFIDLYFVHFQGVREYMDQIVKLAKKQGYVQTLLHRRRYLPDINSSNFNLRSFAERTAMNTPIQGTAADIIKLAMVKLAEELKARNLESRMLLQVHDELIFEVPPHELAEMQELVPSVMETCIKLEVPLKVDVAVGDNWYDAK